MSNLRLKTSAFTALKLLDLFRVCISLRFYVFLLEIFSDDSS